MFGLWEVPRETFCEGGKNKSWSQQTELWFGTPTFWRLLVMTWLHGSEQPNPTDFNGPSENLIQLQLQFPHWTMAVTSGWLSPCTKSCNSSWQEALNALLVFCFPFCRATQCHAAPSCQSIHSTEHHLELMPTPGALFSSCRPTAVRRARPSFILWNETGSFWRGINKHSPPLQKQAAVAFLTEVT